MNIKPNSIHVVGLGLAGSEAVWQLSKMGCPVVAHEMRPSKLTPAHKTGGFAEMVCSNTFKSTKVGTASQLLKTEMATFDSLTLKAAYNAQVPAGDALGVDRDVFSKFITEKINNLEIDKFGDEVTEIPTEAELAEKNAVVILATGPLTSDAMATSLSFYLEAAESLYFYDAIAPVVSFESIQMEHCFRGSRYLEPAEGDAEVGDYLNIPLNKDEYVQFISEISNAKKIEPKEFENPNYFECCLPIEVMVERGPDTPRFGPMKPVGLVDPKTGWRPYANIQLRQENKEGTMWSLVGFQTKMAYSEQVRVFRTLKALENAEFLRLGSIHRNTYVHGPRVLATDMSLKKNSRVFLAGQISGVEGYGESAAMGILAAKFANAKLRNEIFTPPPQNSMMGALYRHIVGDGSGVMPKNFQPMNANMGLLPPAVLPQIVEAPKKKQKMSKSDRRMAQFTLSQTKFNDWKSSSTLPIQLSNLD